MGNEFPAAANVRNNADNSFVNAAAAFNANCIDMVQTASAKDSDSRAADFENATLAELQAGERELQQINCGGARLTDQPSAEEQSWKAAVTNTGGAAFEKAYLRQFSTECTIAIAAFQDEIAHGQYKFIQQYATSRLPGLIAMQDSAQSLLQQM